MRAYVFSSTYVCSDSEEPDTTNRLAFVRAILNIRSTNSRIRFSTHLFRAPRQQPGATPEESFRHRTVLHEG
jgi:hypothetical protein